MSPAALIIGVSGQDGAYLARLLLEKGYRVFGTHRPSGSLDLWRLRHLGLDRHPRLELLEFDLGDLSAAIRLLRRTAPDEIYNLAAGSPENPLAAARIEALGPVGLLEALRQARPEARFFQASCSAMFGRPINSPQNEASPFRPASPHGAAKLHAHWMTALYREEYGLYAASGIMFDHYSPLAAPDSPGRRLTRAAAAARLGRPEAAELGDLSARREWGHAQDYAEGMWRALQAPKPSDYVLAAGRAETARTFAALAFQTLGMELPGGAEAADETPVLSGDPSKARAELGWEAKTSLEDLARLMAEAELASLKGGGAGAR